MRRYRQEVVRRVLGLAPGVLTTILLIWLVPPDTALDAMSEVSIGLVTSLLGLVLVDVPVLESQIRSYRQDVHNLNSLLGGQLALGALGRTMLELGSLEVPGQEFHRFYLNVLWSIEHSYLTTFLATDTSGEESHNRLALEIQRTKIRVSDANIRRLFIFMDDAQRDSHRRMMQRQTEAGIDVKYIYDRSLTDERALRDWARRLGCTDFSIVDGTIAMSTSVAASRGRRVSIERSVVTCEPGRVRDFQFFFSLLWERGVPP